VLDQTPAHLKPGMSASAEIFVSRASNALAVPLQSLYSAGNDSYVFVPDASHPRGAPVKVKLGMINDTHAQIVSGLSQGQNVRILEAGEGRDLLELAGIKIEGPTTRSSDSDYVNPRRRGGGGRNGNGQSGAPPGAGGPGQAGAPATPGAQGMNDRPSRDAGARPEGMQRDRGPGAPGASPRDTASPSRDGATPSGRDNGSTPGRNGASPPSRDGSAPSAKDSAAPPARTNAPATPADGSASSGAPAQQLPGR
jgi:hypothetical protein